jgi:hypothetical protein
MSILSFDETEESGYDVRPRRDAEAGTGPLYIVCSPRRTVGKTLLARLLAEFYFAHDRPIAAFDLADEGPQLCDYLPDVTTAVELGSMRGQMAFFDRLIGEKHSAKVVDVSHRMFRDFFVIANKIGILEEAMRRGIEPILLFMIDPDEKSAGAYSILQRWFAEISLLPVRNQSVANGIPYWGAFPNESPIHVALEIPLLTASVKTLVSQPSFSFARFQRTQSICLPVRLDDELRGFIRRVFRQFCEIETRRMCGDVRGHWSSNP